MVIDGLFRLSEILSKLSPYVNYRKHFVIDIQSTIWHCWICVKNTLVLEAFMKFLVLIKLHLKKKVNPHEPNLGKGFVNFTFFI